MTDSLPCRRARPSCFAAVFATAATYLFFLLFAEFAFLELARRTVSAGQLGMVMLALGAGGIAGSIGAALLFQPSHARAWLTWAFRACATSGAMALLADNAPMLHGAGFTSGLSLGALTVVLASTLRHALGPKQPGVWIGLGTGAAYALCNLPWVFHASPMAQTVIASSAAAAASWLPRWMIVSIPHATEFLPIQRSAIARYVIILLALVWLDSAAFYIIQHTPALRALTWERPTTLVTNAAIHLGVAVLAGVALDRGRRQLVLAAAMAALALAAGVLNGTLPDAIPAHLLYTAGVSLYSVALVELPTRSGRPVIAALVFAVAGWAGSGFGIGMAQDLAHIPNVFLLATLTIVGAALAWRARGAGRVIAVAASAAGIARAGEAERGREVYIAEGCIHCHSQYVRPRVAREVLIWGPPTPLSEALSAEPPLFGTRRQGPDLSRVGNRRTAEWNRLHLILPQVISPGSKMPSYAHLFSRGDERGSQLLTYLASLGSDTLTAREHQIAGWRPDSRAVVADATAARLFNQLCAQCHGATGRGNGILAAQLSVRPPDWTRETWRNVPRAPASDTEEALCRIIKFGLIGRPMAGHEYLPDAEIVGLARHVQKLQAAGGSDHAAFQP